MPTSGGHVFLKVPNRWAYLPFEFEIVPVVWDMTGHQDSSYFTARGQHAVMAGSALNGLLVQGFQNPAVMGFICSGGASHVKFTLAYSSLDDVAKKVRPLIFSFSLSYEFLLRDIIITLASRRTLMSAIDTIEWKLHVILKLLLCMPNGTSNALSQNCSH